MSSSYSVNILQKAAKIEVIPQYGNTSWFNAILTALLYSEGLRQFVYKKALEWQSDNPEELKRNKFKQLLMYILKYNYTQPRKIVELFKSRVKPELLLLSYLDYYYSENIEITKPSTERTLEYHIQSRINALKSKLKNFDYGFYSHFIYLLFKSLFEEEKDFLQVYFIKGNIYLNARVPLNQSSNPEVLLLLHDDLIKLEMSNRQHEIIQHEGIDTYQETITFNDSFYKLDCCLARNFDFMEKKFTNLIAGLTYNKEGFVYNGWVNQTYNKETTEYTKKHTKACKLFPRDWKEELHLIEGSAPFCLADDNCDGFVEVGNVCYDFSKKNQETILIYVKIDDDSLNELSSLNVSSVIDYSSSSIERLSETFHQLRGKSLDELLEIAIIKVGYNKEQLEQVIDNLTDYSTLFFILCKRRYGDYSEGKSIRKFEELNKKDFLIALIEFYLKNTKILDLRNLNEKDILNNIRFNTLKKAVLSIRGYELLKDPSSVGNYLILFHLLNFEFHEDEPIILSDDFKKMYHYLLLFLLQVYVRHKGDEYDIYDLELYIDENIISQFIHYIAKEQSQQLRKLSLLNTNDISEHHRNLLKEKIMNFFRSARELSSEAINQFLKQLLQLTPEDVRYLVRIQDTPLKLLSTDKELFHKVVSDAGYDKQKLLDLITNLENYSILFFILCKKRLEEGSKEDNISAILKVLLEKHLNKEELLQLENYTNAKIRDNLRPDTLVDYVNLLGYTITYTTSHFWLILHNCLLSARIEPYILSERSGVGEIMLDFIFNLFETYIFTGQLYDLDLYIDEKIISQIYTIINGKTTDEIRTIFEFGVRYKITRQMRSDLLGKIGVSKEYKAIVQSVIFGLSLEKLRNIQTGRLNIRSYSKTTDEPPLELVVLDRSSYVSGRQLLNVDKIEVLPQFGDTCWFNAILMVMLYSQGLRNFVYQKALEWQSEESVELEQNKFKRFLMYILKYNYTQPRKITELFEKQISPELLLLSYLEQYHPNDGNPALVTTLKSYLREEFDYAIYIDFISDIFQSLFHEINEDFLELFFSEGKLYLNVTNLKTQHPKVLLLYHDAFRIINSKEAILETTIKHEGISDYRREITFNGQRYKLDSCCFSNYNKSEPNKIGHAICSLTYDNQGYVYNGWTTTSLKQEYKLSATEKITYRKKIRKACKLFQRDWKTELHAEEGTAGFCLPQKDCPGLLDLDKEDLCYDFSKKNDRKILIYVREDVYDLQALNLQSLASAKPETLNYSSLSVGRLSDKFHQLKEKSISELIKIAVFKKIIDEEELFILLENLDKYRYLFYILCKKNLSQSITESDIKAILIAILELHLTENNVFTIKGLDDNSEIMQKILTTLNDKNVNVSEYSILFNSLLNFNKSPYNFYEYQEEHFRLNQIFCIELLKAFFYNYYFFENLEMYKDELILNALQESSPEYLAQFGLEEKSIYLIPKELYKKLNRAIKKRNLNSKIIVGLTLNFLKTFMEPKPLRIKSRRGGAYTKKRQLKSYK